MKLVDFLPTGCFVPDLKATTKEAAVGELLDALIGRGYLARKRKKEVLEALMAREGMGSTGIGRGVAVPHAAHRAVERLVGAVGLSQKGVEFDSLDGQPADLVFLVLSPQDCPERTQALRLVSQLLREEDLRRFLRAAKDGEDVHALLREAETRLEVG